MFLSDFFTKKPNLKKCFCPFFLRVCVWGGGGAKVNAFLTKNPNLKTFFSGGGGG